MVWGPEFRVLDTQLPPVGVYHPRFSISVDESVALPLDAADTTHGNVYVPAAGMFTISLMPQT
jgi:hypothetical protein